MYDIVPCTDYLRLIVSPDYYLYSFECLNNLSDSEIRLSGPGYETRLFEYDIRCPTVYLLPDRDVRYPILVVDSSGDDYRSKLPLNVFIFRVYFLQWQKCLVQQNLCAIFHFWTGTWSDFWYFLISTVRITKTAVCSGSAARKSDFEKDLVRFFPKFYFLIFTI